MSNYGENMKILLLDENEKNMTVIGSMLVNEMQGVTVIKYTTAFSFITGIYDEFKGDVDLALIYIKDNNDEKIKMAQDVQEYFPHIKVIFYSEKTISAEVIFKAIPSFFFGIPIENKKVMCGIKRVEKDISYYNNSSLKIVSKGQIIKLRFETINYMESAGRKIAIYSTSGNYETFSTMDDMMKQLPDYFFKCHRSYIVNLYKVTSLNKNDLSVMEKYLIPLSRNLKDVIKLRLKEI